MTNSSNQNDNDIRAILTELAQRQLQAQTQIEQTQAEILETNLTVRELTNDVNRVLARSGVLDDVVLELRETQAVMQMNQEVMQRNFEQHQRNFETHQATTNAALSSLEAILLQFIRMNEQG